MAGSLGLVIMAEGCDSKCDFGECSGPGDGAADSGGDTRIGVDTGHVDGTVGDTAMDGPGGDTGFSDGPVDSAPDTMDASDGFDGFTCNPNADPATEPCVIDTAYGVGRRAERDGRYPGGTKVQPYATIGTPGPPEQQDPRVHSR